MYNIERGFGFLNHPMFLGPTENVFFHISKIERSSNQVAKKLSTYKEDDEVCFWYISESTDRGVQLNKIISADDVFSLQQENAENFIEKIENLWLNIEKPPRFWVQEVSLGLIGQIGTEKLLAKRENLIQERNKVIETQRKEEERLRKLEDQKRDKQRKIIEEKRKLENEERLKRMAEIERQQILEEEEFELLVAEMEPKGFGKSGEISNYIIRNRLGDKYKHISGVLEMENGTSSWKFNGGFPPNIYARLCSRLGLGNEGTRSRVVGFTSFKDLQ